MALGFIISLTSIGLAIAHRVASIRSSSLFFPLAVALGVPAYGIIGLVLSLLPAHKQIAAAGVLLLVNLAAFWLNARDWRQLREKLADAVVPMAMWTVASLLYVLVTFYPARLPDVLIDGPYVSKKDTLAAHIQSLVGDLPMDNEIPAIVSEYLIRGISFRENRPVVPGQEVSNRPILMSLVVVPIRVLLGPTETGPAHVPRFSYVGQTWPDFSVLVTDGTFRQFLAVAIPLNATILLSIWYLGGAFGLDRRLLAAATICLAVLSPYVLIHSIFTWPKNLAAMFVILGALVVFFRQSPGLAGGLIGLAYWSHSYALAFAVSLGLYYFWEWSGRGGRLAAALGYAAGFIVTVLPWFVWTQLIVRIPSDLIAQNLNAHLSLLAHLWVRLSNLTALLFPVAFMAPAFSALPFVQAFTTSLAGMVGILFFLPGLFAVFRYMRDYQSISMWTAVVPGLALIAVFSFPAVPAMHGWQAISPIILLLAVKLLQAAVPRKALLGLILLQGIINVGVIALYAHERMPRCPENAGKCPTLSRFIG